MEVSRKHGIKTVFLSVSYDVKHGAPVTEDPNWKLLDDRWLPDFIDKL